MDCMMAISLTALALLLVAASGVSGSTSCGLLSCPNVFTRIADSIADSDSSKSYCCQSRSGMGIPYCCDWKDYAAYLVGLDPNQLAIPIGAIIGIIVGGLVLLILLSICCCFCCGLCCFRGRKRVITQHRTISYGKPGDA